MRHLQITCPDMEQRTKTERVIRSVFKYHHLPEPGTVRTKFHATSDVAERQALLAQFTRTLPTKMREEYLNVLSLAGFVPAVRGNTVVVIGLRA